MFAEHQPTIAFDARNNGIFPVLLFVQATINQRLYQVPRIIENYKKHGFSAALTGAQHHALDHAKMNQRKIHNTVFSSVPVAEKLTYLASQPGYGLVKAGFILQLCLGISGCIDTHNMAKYGIERRHLRADCTYEKLFERAETYQYICEKIGSEQLWNDWCVLIAGKYPNRFEDAEQVSQLHVACICE